MSEVLRCRRKLASTWAGIVDRCHNPDSPSYYCYGARGIEMCKRWQQSVDAFMQDMGMPPSMKHSIDRINCNGNYEPSNCRWATQEEQNNNTRRSKLITWNGKTQSIRDWAEEYNIGPRRLSERLRRGWDIKKSLETPGGMTFNEEREGKKVVADNLWKAKGKLYQARSKQKRGQQLSLSEQKVIETAEEEAISAGAKAFYEQREYDARQSSAHQRILRQEFLEWS